MWAVLIFYSGFNHSKKEYFSISENTEYLKTSEKMNQSLDWKLKGVYVKSEGEVKDTLFFYSLNSFE